MPKEKYSALLNLSKGGFSDPTDVSAGRKAQVIDFFHIPTKSSVVFKAWITDFQDNFESTWNSEEVYGRMDPIQTFQGTKRTIVLAWDVVAASEAEARDNMERCSILFQMLYPVYEGSAMKSPPLLKLRVLNLVQDITKAGKNGTTATAQHAGLVGTVGGFSYTPDFDAGVYDPGLGTIYPRVVSIQCTFTCLHSHPLGSNLETSRPGSPTISTDSRFPYNQNPSHHTSTTALDGEATYPLSSMGPTKRTKDYQEWKLKIDPKSSKK